MVLDPGSDSSEPESFPQPRPLGVTSGLERPWEG